MPNQFLILSILFVLSQSRIVYGNFVAFDKRIVCNSDNCLRQLQATSTLASPYCSAYLGSPSRIFTTTATVTTTVFTTSTIMKRSLEDATPAIMTTTAIPPLITQNPLKRQAMTPSYVSECTENPNALSSGCSCLISQTVPTSTITSTSTISLSFCDAANNYGRYYDDFSYARTGLTFSYEYFGNETGLGQCCNRCYNTPGCFIFYEGQQTDNGVAEYTFCDIILASGPGPANSQNPACPYGSVSLDSLFINPTFTHYYGYGPCQTPPATMAGA